MQESAPLRRFAYTFSRRLFAFSMPPITALLHTDNDARRLGRALETLRVCDEIVIVDHESEDATVRIAREYGARVVMAGPDEPLDFYLKAAHSSWIFCLEARESVSEGLEATLLEWKSLPPVPDQAFSIGLREETPDGWAELSLPQIRLVPRHWRHWQHRLPANDSQATALEGELLRFVFP